MTPVTRDQTRFGKPGRARFLGAALVISLFASCASADGAALVVERFGVERGLPIENVTAIHQDRAGFLWIGTREGLILYDGSSITTFEHDIGDPDSIADNYVRTVFEDSQGRLWIGTNSSGLEMLDRSRWAFRHHPYDSSDPSTISHDSVNVILEARDGTLWVGTQIGLNRFDPEAGTFERILHDPDDPSTLSNDYVYALCEDRSGAIWVATVGGGLNRFDRQSGAFERFGHDPAKPASLSSDQVFALVEDSEGALWIGSDAGLDRLDPTRTTLTHFAHDPELERGLSYPLVTGLVFDAEGTLWISTWGGGVDRLDTRSGSFLPAPAETMPELARERSSALALDRDGAVWIGTWSQGVIRAREPAVQTALITTDEGLAFDDATAVLEDAEGRLWVGTWGSGLSLRHADDARFDPDVRERFAPLTEGTVLSLHDAGGGSAWVGTMGPLFRVSTTGSPEEFAHDPTREGSIGPGYVTAVLRDSDGRVWAGVGGSGLYRLREDGRSFDAFVHDPDDPATLSDNYITSLVEDREGHLWVGTRSGGVNVLDRTRGLVTRYGPDPDVEGALSYHYVTSLALDGEGVVWIGTAGGGLNRAERIGAAFRFERYEEDDGLIDDTVRSLAADGTTLWIGTAHGLARFDTVNGEFWSFDEGDGLPTTGFNADAAAVGADTLYFGCSSGLLAIPRRAELPEVPSAPTILRSIRTLEDRAPVPSAPWELDSLVVNYGEILSFGFAVLDYGDPRRHRFAYRLVGLRDDWIELGDRREITFTDLDPGEYTLEIRGRSARGAWSTAERALDLRVVPPFWMTTWFRLAGFVLIAFAVYGAHKRRTEVLKRRNRELAALKDARESALKAAEESQEELSAAYDRLRRLTRRLEQAKEDERQRIARELHDEMGQGLTAAKINLELLAASNASSEEGARAADTIALVDGMIQHVRTLSLDLRPPLLDELGLRPALRGYIEAQAQRSGLEIDISSMELPDELPAEVEITAFRFVQEALTNVIRHAGAKRVVVRAHHEGDELHLRVSDDGTGFDLENAMQRAAGGHHLGLLGIRERVESLGGTLEIESAIGQGSSLDVAIPWR